jgi:hypothetical protein
MIEQPGVAAMYDLKVISCPACRIKQSVSSAERSQQSSWSPTMRYRGRSEMRCTACIFLMCSGRFLTLPKSHEHASTAH